MTTAVAAQALATLAATPQDQKNERRRLTLGVRRLVEKKLAQAARPKL